MRIPVRHRRSVAYTRISVGLYAKTPFILLMEGILDINYFAELNPAIRNAQSPLSPTPRSRTATVEE